MIGARKICKTDFRNSVVLLNLAFLRIPVHRDPNSIHLIFNIEVKYLHYGPIQLPSMIDECLPGTIQFIGVLIYHLEVSVSHY